MSTRTTHSIEAALHYITFTCYQWLPLFQLYDGYELVYNWFDFLKEKYKIKTTAFTIMPNHVHCILFFHDEPRWFKCSAGHLNLKMAVGLCPVKLRFACKWFYDYISGKTMATRYRFGDSHYPHFITFAVINWIDALSRPIYKEIIIESLKYCQQEKGLIINGWIIMSNHVHLIARSKPDFQLADIMRDLKKFTSKKIEEAIRQNVYESRREWMLWMFKERVKKTATISIFNFGSRIIIL